MAGTFTNLLFHIVFSTRDREPMITGKVRPELFNYIGGIIRNEGGVLLEIGAMQDHVHLLAKIRADQSVAEIVRLIKANSSKWMNEKPGRESRFEWQGGYGAFTVSESQLPVARKYILSQEEHHSSRSFQEEFVEMLNRHGLKFDEKYIWK
jgi:REP element-mobilizing transposase RayT